MLLSITLPCVSGAKTQVCETRQEADRTIYTHWGVFGDKTSEEQDTVECNQQQNAVESNTRGEKIKISKKKNETSKRRILKTPVNYIRTTN